MIQIPIAEGKNKFTYYVHLAEEGIPVQVCRHGKPVAVISSVEMFEEACSGENYCKEIESLKNKYGADFSSKIDDSFIDQLLEANDSGSVISGGENA